LCRYKRVINVLTEESVVQVNSEEMSDDIHEMSHKSVSLYPGSSVCVH
jgi:NADH/NAD ratio-sensing transcriptional regulator Rex